jgi:hypothetical protein
VGDDPATNENRWNQRNSFVYTTEKALLNTQNRFDDDDNDDAKPAYTRGKTIIGMLPLS